MKTVRIRGAGIGAGAIVVPWCLAPRADGEPPPLPLDLGRYRIEPNALTSEAALGDLVRRAQPPLMVMDADACRSLGGAALWRLHVRFPEVRMLLAWPAPAREWLAWLRDMGATGAVPRLPDARLWPRAFDAVLEGELWLPRQALQWMYAELIQEHADAADDAVETEARESPTRLTPREADALACMREGLTNREIGDRLCISINTVKKHLASAYAKVGIRARRQALAADTEAHHPSSRSR